MNKPAFVVRKSLDVDNEFDVISKYFYTTHYRTEVPPNSLVFGRYSFLPFYKELEEEVGLNGSKLSNSLEQHEYIAIAKNWISDLSSFTPKTYENWFNIPEGSYIVKGSTNSKKSNWNTHMFAETKDDVRKVAERLMDDTHIISQGLIIREYIPLISYGEDINGLPITNEWRFFFYKDKLLSYGWYWAIYPDIFELHRPAISSDAIALAQEIAHTVSKSANFFVLDMAQTRSGDWILIEVNDGNQSGLGMNDPHVLFSKLKDSLN